MFELKGIDDIELVEKIQIERDSKIKEITEILEKQKHEQLAKIEADFKKS